MAGELTNIATVLSIIVGILVIADILPKLLRKLARFLLLYRGWSPKRKALFASCIVLSSAIVIVVLV